MKGNPPSGTGCLIVMTTFANAEDARSTVSDLLGKGLIACGTLLPGANSMYRWEGTVHSEQEIVVLLKTTEQKWTELLEEVVRVHPYEVPEVLALPIEDGSEDYLAWVRSETLQTLRETD